MSTELLDVEIQEAIALLSGERLAALKRITGTDRGSYELHQQMLYVAAALMPVTGLVEIALRNAACDRLSEIFGVTDWLNSPPLPFKWRGEEMKSLKRAIRQGQRAEYAKKSQNEKKILDAIAYPLGVPINTTHEKRASARQKAISIDNGQQISQLTIYFWKRLFSKDYETTLWVRGLRRVFPNKDLNRPDISIQLEVIYQARNRIAHHEPLYGQRLESTLEALDFVAQNLNEPKPSPSATLCKMIDYQRKVLQYEADKLSRMLSAY